MVRRTEDHPLDYETFGESSQLASTGAGGVKDVSRATPVCAPTRALSMWRRRRLEAAFGSSVIVAPGSDCAAHTAGDRQDHADDENDDSQRPENGHMEKQADDQENDAENNHCAYSSRDAGVITCLAAVRDN
jgi:hypothetical protein